MSGGVCLSGEIKTKRVSEKEMMQNPLFLRIKDYIGTYQMIQPGDNVLAAVSGGADSVFLMRVLKELSRELPCTVRVVHVEHGIRGEDSLRDAAFVEKLCQKEGITCLVEHVNAPLYAKQSGTGIEEAARTLRYQVFERIAKEEQADRIAVAHHMEDNAETMLFHLARGTGLLGLAGIPPVRGRIIRPLLCVSREEIEAWLTENGQPWCMDETNADVSLSRNLIRAEVLPKLKEINPSAVLHMAETAELLRKTGEYLDRETAAALENAKDGDRTSVIKLTGLDPAAAEHLVYRTLQRVAGRTKDITRMHVRSVCDLAKKPVGKQVSLPYGMVAERTYDAIRVVKQSGAALGFEKDEDCSGEKPVAQNESLKIPGRTLVGKAYQFDAKIILYDGEEEKIPRNPYTKWFDYDKIKNGLQIRGRNRGDYLQIDRKGGHKSIQDYMVNEKIPAKDRDRILLLADGSHIVWVIGRRISEAYKVTKETKRVLVLTVTCADSKGEAK